jgi:hypothetical protein
MASLEPPRIDGPLMVTDTPGRTAPDVSVTRPSKDPVDSWGLAGIANRSPNTANMHTILGFVIKALLRCETKRNPSLSTYIPFQTAFANPILDILY